VVLRDQEDQGNGRNLVTGRRDRARSTQRGEAFVAQQAALLGYRGFGQIGVG
jgi:hypothetical protein